jgi:Spy/CpxP family protein refolding chaperone
MSDQIPAAPKTTSVPARSGRLAKAAVILALGLGLVGAGAVATSSFSQGFGSPFGFGPGPGFGHGPGHWRGGPFGGGFDPARAEERADRMIRHISVEVDATAEQQEKLRGIVKNAVKDMVPMREKLFAARKQARDLLLAQNIDRAAIEKLRTEQLAVADTLSKRFTQALIDAAEVLNPDQRHKLEDILPPAGRWRGWSRG